MPASDRGRLQVAVDAVFDSVSVATTFRETLKKAGVIFCPISEAVRDHPELVQQYHRLRRAGVGQLLRGAELGGVHRRQLRLRAEGRALPDGAVHLFPHQCAQHRPVRAHADHRRRGQLCELPGRLHGADARREPAACGGGRAGRARRCADQVLARCRTGTRATRKAAAASTTSSPSAAPAVARESRSRWTQVETGSAITWKYPSCVLQGDDSVGEFYSVAVTNNCQQADTGTKMIHIGKRHEEHHRLQGHQRRAGPTTPIAAWCACCRRRVGRAQLHAVRQPADRRPVRRAYRALYREPQPDREGGARGDHRRRSPTTSCSTAASAACREEDAVEPDRQWLLQGGAEGTADGVRRRGAEAAGGEPGRLRGLEDTH